VLTRLCEIPGIFSALQFWEKQLLKQLTGNLMSDQM